MERYVWELLTRDFYWQVPAEFAVKVYGESSGPTRLQVFEVAVAATFARYTGLR